MYYRDVFKELEGMRRELEKAFGGGAWERPFSRISFLPGISAHRYPMINILGDKDNLYVEALAPSVDPEKLDVSVTGNNLTISGEKVSGCGDVKSEEYHRCERAAGKFIRTVELPSHVDAEKIEAEYTNGILKITLPKAESAKPKRIAITAG
jgi:HSP20 family protein